MYGDQQDYYKRSGQIPAFGNWDYANELPITQYFECARQAGLIRFSSSSGESADAYVRPADLYAVNHLNKPKPSRKVLPLISIQLSFLLPAVFTLSCFHSHCICMFSVLLLLGIFSVQNELYLSFISKLENNIA